MTAHKDNNHPSFDPLKSLFIILEVSRFGRVKAVFPVVQNDREEKLLMNALDRWRSSKGKGAIGNE
jgi:hypothetical protein